MNAYFDVKKNILNRFFFIFGNTDDSFCGNNIVYMDLKFSLNKLLKDCGYKRTVFYGKNERIHCYDDESFNLLRGSQEKREEYPAQKAPMRLKGPLKTRLVSAVQPAEKPAAAGESGKILHFNRMEEVDAFNWIDVCMKDKKIKTAVVITDANNFIDYFGANMEDKRLVEFNKYAASTLGHENSNIMLFIFPSQFTVDEYNKNGGPIWNKFFKPKLEQGKVTEIYINYPLLGEIRNAVNYFRLRHGLKVELSQMDSICRSIAKNYYAKNRTLDSLNLLMAELKDIADNGSVLNNEAVSAILGKQENPAHCRQLSATFAFRGVLANLSEEEIKEAEDIALDRKKAVSVDEVLKDLDAMVGMAEVKKMVRSLAQKLQIEHEKVEIERAEAALKGEEYKPKTTQVRNNIVITGNPGTGKTTIVDKLAKLFHAIGLTSTETLVRCTGDELKAPYQGQTPDKINDLCNRATGGILFIDEAYTLTNEQGPVDSFANEAIGTLITQMENNGHKFITIIAGYKKEIELFLVKSNQGMESRFQHHIHIPDYTAEELIKIFTDFNVESQGYSLTKDAHEEAKKLIRNMVASKKPNFGNAREVRDLFETHIKARQSARIYELTKEERKEKIKVIEAIDIRGEEDKTLSIDDVLAELDAMTGMADVKKKVREIAVNIAADKKREDLARAAALERGEKWEPKADKKKGNHIILTGNPGTGKTTITRTLAKLYKAIGALPTDNIIEKNGNDLKSEFQGDSKNKVNEYVRQAIGGVLFIDEAYVLANERGPVDSGAKEAAETLMTHLENAQGKFICVAAGYETNMGLFLDKLNDGMRRRFTHFIKIADYSAAELYEIFVKSFMEKSGFTMTDAAKDAARKSIDAMVRKKQPNFGNAGEMRKLYEEVVRRQSGRVCALGDDMATYEIFHTIEAEDIGDAAKTVSIDNVLAELDAMVGMIEVKEAVRGIANKIAYQKKIFEITGKAPDAEGNNICITGNPGTGKTTIVRTLAKLFKAIDLLPDDKPLEIQGGDLKGSFVGQSKDKVNEYCRQAFGRVFFIDEAYSLVGPSRGGGIGPVDEFAQEAITNLLAHLENERDRYVCVVAGYKNKMDDFIKYSNPGMERRFKHYINIPDYSADELIEIFERFNVGKGGYTLTAAAQEKARETIFKMVANKEPNFGNAGTIRTFYENITTNTANRVSKLPNDQQIAVLQVIEAEDIPEYKGGIGE